MKFAYADPPYLGCGKLYIEHHPDALIWDDQQTHFDLVDRLFNEYSDGWAYSCNGSAAPYMLGYANSQGRGACRMGIWVKPFAIFKPNVNPAYTYEAVIWSGGRKRTREQETIRDWVSANVTLKRGLTGAKPRAFCRWIFSLLNAERSDTLDDLFPGSGAVGTAWQEWIGAGTSQLTLMND